MTGLAPNSTEQRLTDALGEVRGHAVYVSRLIAEARRDLTAGVLGEESVALRLLRERHDDGPALARLLQAEGMARAAALAGLAEIPPTGVYPVGSENLRVTLEHLLELRATVDAADPAPDRRTEPPYEEESPA